MKRAALLVLNLAIAADVVAVAALTVCLTLARVQLMSDPVRAAPPASATDARASDQEVR